MDREEVKSFLRVWASAIASLCYCYSVAGSVPKGAPRLVSLLPVFFLLAILPLGLSSFHLAGPTTFLLTWICNFKLFLFSFGAGPLSRSPSYLHFVLIASLPIRIKQDDQPAEARHAKAQSSAPSNAKEHHTRQKPVESQSETSWASRCSDKLDSLHDHRTALSAVNLFLLALLFQAYEYKHHLHPCIVWGLYCLHAFLELELVLAIYAIPAWIVLGGLGLELEPQFKEPYLTTSLEDFWGRRWNLTVSEILRLTIYNPLRTVCIPAMGPELGSYAAVFATFTVSGLMHEALFYYYTRAEPTWEVTVFFLVQGACVVTEKAVKKRYRESWQPHRLVSGVLTLGFLSVTAIRLFALPLTRHGIDEKAIRECHHMAKFLKERVQLIVGSENPRKDSVTRL